MKKRFLSLVFALVMVCTMLPTMPLTAEAATQESWLWPVKDCRIISSNFGWRDLYGSGYYDDMHRGIDISDGRGDLAVRASKSGSVITSINTCPHDNNDAACSCNGSAGNYIVIKHEDGTYSRYLHLRAAGMHSLGSVKQGDTIGYVGSSGQSYGYHLHFDICTDINNRYSTMLNPMPTNGEIAIRNSYSLPEGWPSAKTTYIFEVNTLIKESYPSYCAIEVSSSTTYVKSLPCSEETDSNSKNVESEPAKKGDTYQAIGLAENKFGNLWYKVIAENGKTGYMYAGDTTYIAQTISDIKGSGITAPTTHKAGAIYALTGTVSSTYNQLTAVSAYVYAGNSEQGSRETGASASVSGNSYSLGGSAIDNQTEFNKLPVGTHTYVVWASYKNYYAKSATSVGTNTGETGIYKATFSVVSGSSSHTCDKGTYMYFEAVHPHRSCYKCSVCGTIWAVDGTSNYYDACTECTSSKMPGKPVLQFSSNGTDAAPVTFTWASTANTTHYNMWIRKKNSSGEWESYEHLTYISSGVTRTLPAGEYRLELQSYNSKAWMDDGTDWAHALGDYVYLTINCYCSYTDIVTQEATCTQPGVLTYICSKCGNGYTETIPATGHRYEQWYTQTPGNCTTGEIQKTNCVYCGMMETQILPAIGHTYGNWVITTSAGCTTAGTQKKTCSSCGDVQTQSIPATGYHSWGAWGVTKEATCTTPGEKSRKCYVCWYDEFETVPATGHSYGSWATTTAAGCTTTGTQTKTCSSCGDVQTQSIPATGHNFELGYCTACGEFSGVGVCGENLTWTLDDAGVLTISGTGDMYDYEFESNNAPWYDQRASITQIIIDRGVTSIGDWAFSYCNNLTSITVPDSVTSIGYHTFDCCTKLVSVTIGEHVTSIGEYAFSNCTSLTSVTIPNSVTSIGGSAFRGCGSLIDITIPDNVTIIGDYAFYYCNSLLSVTIPDSVTSIGKSAFESCNNLTDITIGDGVTSIGDAAFCYCYKLTSVTMGDSVTSIGNDGFGSCDKLTSITIPDSVTSIGKSAFFHSGLKYVTIPGSVKSIGNDAFSSCYSLTSVTIQDGTVSIGHWAFDGCDKLANITIPDSVSDIGDFAFSECDNLTDVYYEGARERWEQVRIGEGNDCLTNATLHYALASRPCGENLTWTYNETTGTLTISGSGDMTEYTSAREVPWAEYRSLITEVIVQDGATSIGAYAFRDCVNLTAIKLPDSIKTIGRDAFYNCTNLSAITIPNGVTSIEETTFAYCGLTSVVLPSNLTTIGRYAFHSSSKLTTITIPNSVTSIGDYAFYDCLKLTSINIPDGIKSIGIYTFYGCSSLNSIEIPDSVTYIGDSAFKDCSSLTSINIPDGIKTIDRYSFYGCSKLTSIEIPDSVTSIRSYAFERCSGLTSITVPGSVTSIGDYAFQYCTQLDSVTIPDSVTAIGASAFYYCNKLTDVYFDGVPAQWAQISIGNGNQSLINATLHITKVIVDEQGNGYSTLAEVITAVEAGATLKLLQNIDAVVTVDKNVCIDLNGFDITGDITVAEGCTLLLKDSQTDDFTIADSNGYGKLTSANGTVVAADGYMMIREDTGTSFHKVELKIESMVLRASDAGIYYKSKICGDEMVAQNVARYGVVFDVNSAPEAVLEHNASWFESFAPGATGNSANGTLVYGIMKSVYSDRNNAARAELDIYGRAYILTNDGQYILGENVCRTFREQVELVNQQWSQLTAEQKTVVLGMYALYQNVMQKWSIPNIIEAAA